MKFIVIGLGNFGSSLAIKLTQMGHEVIGADSDNRKVETVMGKITNVIMMDCTDEAAINTLPLNDTDAVIISIGEDFGASIMITALLKELKVKRLISRALSPLHEKVIRAIGITEIVHPEQESADRFAQTLDMKDIIDSFDVSDKHKIVEVNIPENYIGKTIQEIDIRQKYHLNILTVIKNKEVKNIFGVRNINKIVADYITPQTKLEKGDLLLVFAKTSDIKKFLNSIRND